MGPGVVCKDVFRHFEFLLMECGVGLMDRRFAAIGILHDVSSNFSGIEGLVDQEE
nr:hypothetical protein [uncultured Prevotella sp.]